MDVYHVIGSDFKLTESGDLMLSLDLDETNQRIVRRLLTTKGSYFWNSEYGASLPAYVGEDVSVSMLRTLEADVKASVLADKDVASDPAPTFRAEVTKNGIIYYITYVNLRSEKQDTITFKVGE